MIELHKLGIDALNAMQQDTAQAYRKSDSLVLLSPTGSGKTLAYLLPLLETIKPGQEGLQAIVIVPSRELALQSNAIVSAAGGGVRSMAVYGGRPAMEEHRTMRGLRPQLLFGTPGRLLDHMQKQNIDASTVHTLVIDEFDKCLELGFREEMSQVFAHLPNVRRRMLLSATDNPEITRFLPEYTRLDYLDDDAPELNGRIEQLVVKSPEKDKLETLRRLLLSLGAETTLVFVGFRESVERVARFLREEGFYVSALHGGMEQKDRERALFRFVEGSTNVLVSTDLASRGLDIPALNNVVHYHLPQNEQSLVHRNGRTARWDREGRAFLLVGPEERLGDLPGTQDLPEYCELPASGPIPVPLWESIYIGKGRKEKISRGDIAGFLMKVGGLAKEDVGRIDVRDHYAYAAVSRSKAHDVLNKVRGQKIKGLKTLFERTR